VRPGSNGAVAFTTAGEDSGTPQTASTIVLDGPSALQDRLSLQNPVPGKNLCPWDNLQSLEKPRISKVSLKTRGQPQNHPLTLMGRRLLQGKVLRQRSPAEG
jgi:hypothetical protein